MTYQEALNKFKTLLTRRKEGSVSGLYLKEIQVYFNTALNELIREQLELNRVNREWIFESNEVNRKSLDPLLKIDTYNIENINVLDNNIIITLNENLLYYLNSFVNFKKSKSGYNLIYYPNRLAIGEADNLANSVLNMTILSYFPTPSNVDVGDELKLVIVDVNQESPKDSKYTIILTSVVSITEQNRYVMDKDISQYRNKDIYISNSTKDQSYLKSIFFLLNNLKIREIEPNIDISDGFDDNTLDVFNKYAYVIDKESYNFFNNSSFIKTFNMSDTNVIPCSIYNNKIYININSIGVNKDLNTLQGKTALDSITVEYIVKPEIIDLETDLLRIFIFDDVFVDKIVKKAVLLAIPNSDPSLRSLTPNNLIT